MGNRIGQIAHGLGFLVEVVCVFISRACEVGPKIAWNEGRASVQNFAICQRNKALGADQVECPICDWQGYSFYHQAAGDQALFRCVKTS